MRRISRLLRPVVADPTKNLGGFCRGEVVVRAPLAVPRSLSHHHHALVVVYARSCKFQRCFSTSPGLEEFEIALPETREKSVEEQYSKKTPLEHVLLRPGMYVGPVERSPVETCWVLDPIPEPYDFSKEEEILETANYSASGSFRMASKEYGLIPALIKIFDEILVNASDNRLRNPKTCTKLDVRIDPGDIDREPRIRIWNDGKGIPVQIHSGENMYVPEMLFGHLLTGSNFDDDEKRLTGEYQQQPT